jgi:aldose 1-epimerase
MKSLIKKFGGLFLLIAFAAGCQQGSSKAGDPQNSSSQKQKTTLNLKRSNFQKTIDGKKTNLYKLRNKNGMEVAIMNYGARIVGILAPDKNGHFGDIILGYDSLGGYLHGNNNYFGAIIGRYANRIAGGKFTLDGKQYTLPINDGPNTLHGGTKGFDSRVWDAKQLNDQNLLLTYDSKDGEEGFPGNLKLQVLYTLRSDNSLRISYHAITDKPTVVNFTNHSYFNLGGPGSGKITNEILMINADKFTPTDSTQIPTGKIKSVKGTPFDFNQPTRIGKRINEDNQQLKFAHGYDDNWILNKPKPGKLALAAKLYDPDNGRGITVFTTEPGIQVYTGNFLDGSTSGIGGTYNYRGAVTLETQHYPDSPNHPNFPSTVLKPGQIFNSITIFKFTTQDSLQTK